MQPITAHTVVENPRTGLYCHVDDIITMSGLQESRNTEKPINLGTYISSQTSPQMSTWNSCSVRQIISYLYKPLEVTFIPNWYNNLMAHCM